MQFTAKFTALFFALVAFSPATLNASPTLEAKSDELSNAVDAEGTAGIVTHEEMVRWISSVDPSLLTFIGEPFNPLKARSAQTTTVTYCSKRSGNSCSAPCTVYTGGPTCLNAPDTNCLSATSNVIFCDRAGCGHSCNTLDGCGTRLNNNFCYTPGTASIQVLS